MQRQDLTKKRVALQGSVPRSPPPTPKRLKGQKVVQRDNTTGGASMVAWFNLALDNPRADIVIKHLGSKVANFNVADDCHLTTGNRIQPDKAFKQVASDVGLPAAMESYQAAMIFAGKRRPSYDPPSLPQELRNSRGSGKKKEKQENQLATWVISHLCHDKRCVNINHLVWEPSWYNRLRDNCPGGSDCQHLDNKCLKAHRSEIGNVTWMDKI